MDFTGLFFTTKKLLLSNKIPISILGMIIPFVMVSFVYQLRYRLLPTSYKMAVMGSFSTIAIVPILIVFFQYTPALEVGLCIVDRKRMVKQELEDGKSIEVPLLYKVVNRDEKRYELRSNDNAVIKMRYNLVDLDYRYRIRQGCPGIE